ncbi:MAG: carbohydrate-binding protein [Rhizobiales bacterium 63-7]|mgnify:CR=1 FL=1|uniref:sugar ABC transporter substrate-binding protein n=1 Tax=Rhizobium sp. YJ-22 TaxID=3037556 RepID=UPI00092BE325|nr:sugar ABC transporter substrate-binding protein [Rhizobium sp. YJ-22]MBN9029504.1 sugar ABC transporter substrate-binding protein [Hyphomicrobiales bacterium]MDG3576689.1 sugar ABC transporter substrate-binding protein [Rhizobium sp. YJ-22]OJU71648.1 MAG: carbohydrate-binding protein [Rhizobiales bacterium 63-7]
MTEDNKQPEFVDNAGGFRLTRRGLLSAAAATTVAAALARPEFSWAQNAEKTFCASLGWTVWESGRHIVNGYKDAVERLGGKLTIADANYDVKKQADQILAFVEAKPAAIFITPADAAAISPAVQQAVASGIPIFVGDSYVPNVTVTSTAMSNNFGLGAHPAQYIADQLGGKGKVALVSLPSNESWDQRTLGAKSVFVRYPDIKIVSEIAFALGGSTTPRQVVDQILTANPELDAIWCAWDGAASEGTLAIRASGRPVMITGIDGGQQSFEYIKADSPFKLTMAQSFYEMAYMNAFYAQEVAAGRQAPRFVITPSYAVTKASLDPLPNIPDTYDMPGEAAKLGWARVL